MMTTFLFHKLKIRIMKNYSKILITIIISSLFVLSSCKKEEIIEGCTDSAAMNFNATATANDGSCIFAYDIAQGVWNITPDCEEIDILGQTISLNDQMPESVDIQGAGNNTLFIDMNGTQVTGEIDNDGNITVPQQTVSIDMGMGPMDIDVEGDGKIESENSGYMDLTYSFEIDLGLGIPISESLDCSITLSK